jgi:hypothetical protein
MKWQLFSVYYFTAGPNREHLKILSRDWATRDEVWIGNWIYWALTLATTNSYDSFTELHTPKITVTTAHIKFSQSSLGIAWLRLPVVDVPLPLGSRTLPRPQLSASHFSQLQISTGSSRVRVTLQMAVFCQSVRPGVKAPETHYQFFCNWTLTVIVLV